MSGPSLHKLNAHRSIHDGAVAEGRELMELMMEVYTEKKQTHARMAAEALIEHWETRVIAHADSEEEGFYQDKLDQRPEMTETLAMLRRDHDLLRILVKEARELLDENEGVNDDVIDRLRSVYVLVQIHNREEETLLLDHD